jgi:hypothetical protein
MIPAAMHKREQLATAPDGNGCFANETTFSRDDHFQSDTDYANH